MKFVKSIKPEHLNYYHKLHGGVLSQWIDESAWIYGKSTYPANDFVTKILNVDFYDTSENGDIIQIDIHESEVEVGNTSLRIPRIICSNLTTDKRIAIGYVVLVSVDKFGSKCTLIE